MSHLQLLDENYGLSLDQIDFYRNNGFIKLKNIFDSETLTYFGRLIAEKVAEKIKNVSDLDDRDTYGKAFLQIFNLLLRLDKVI